MSKFLRKDRQNIVAGSSQIAELTFKQLSDSDLKKELGDDIPVGYIAGWASTPDLDSYRHVVEVGAFAASIAERGLEGPKAIKLLLNHKWTQIAGVIKKLEYRGNRLWIEAQLNLNISYVKDAYEAMKMLGGLNFSVGFSLQDYEFKEDAAKREYLLIKRGDLFEVSVVPFPGNDAATMEFIKERGEDDDATPDDDTPFDEVASAAEFEKTLITRGLAKNRSHAEKITRAVKANLHLFGKNKETSPEGDPSERPLSDAKSKIDAMAALVAKMKTVMSAPVAK